MILRVEDGAVLQGLAFRAKGFAQFGGAVGGGSIGASVYARADFEIGAKFISYLSLTHFDESLLYGAINFNLTLRFSIRFWLDIDAGLFHIHLEAGFSASFCLTVALELAASPKGLGGRGTAQLAVSAFGRTLGVSVGFGFGGDLLQTARAPRRPLPHAWLGVLGSGPGRRPRGPGTAPGAGAESRYERRRQRVSRRDASA